jgi:hypothetical protein
MGLLAVLPLVTGCRSVGRYNVKVQVDREDWDRTVQVDFIGVTKTDYPRMNAVDINQYFAPNSDFRRDVDRVTLQFGQDREPVQTLSKRNPAWRRWLGSGAMYLFVLADLPGAFVGSAGEADMRRLVLPLRKKRWPRSIRLLGAPIVIELQSSRIHLLSRTKGIKRK